MKKAFTVLALFAMTMASVGCSTAPTGDDDTGAEVASTLPEADASLETAPLTEAPAAPAESLPVAQELPAPEPMAASEPPPMSPMDSSSSTSSGYSLGSGSSGRGH